MFFAVIDLIPEKLINRPKRKAYVTIPGLESSVFSNERESINKLFKLFEQFGEALPQFTLALTYFIANYNFIWQSEEELKMFGFYTGIVPSTLISIILSAGSIIIGIVTGVVAGKNVFNANYGQYGQSPLIDAARDGDIKRVKEFIKKGIDVDLQDNDGYTALIYASSKGCTKSVQALLDGGAKIDIQDNWGYTAQMMASYYGQLETLQQLLAAGAKPDIKNEDGETAADLACQWVDDKTNEARIKELLANAIQTQNENI